MYPNDYLQRMAAQMPPDDGDDLKQMESENNILIKANKFADKIASGQACWAEKKAFCDYCEHLGYDPAQLLQVMSSDFQQRQMSMPEMQGMQGMEPDMDYEQDMGGY